MDIDQIIHEHGAAIEQAHERDTFGSATGIGMLAAFLMDLKANGYEVLKTPERPEVDEHGDLADKTKMFIAFPGVPYETYRIDDAEEYIAAQVEKGWSHATMVLVDKEWSNDSMTAENRGVLITNVRRLTMPVRNAGEGDW